MDIQERYAEASLKTAGDLRTIAQSKMIRELSTLSLPEIEAVVELVARVIPAGNVPGVILNGLARLSGRKPPLKILKRDINLLFTGIEQSLDKAVYSAFFAGPAAVIWGYQNLLRLAGKDPDDSFPEGIWQFYADYALREDTARHTNETHGFDTTLSQHQIHLSQVDRTTAWVMAAIHCLHQYNDLLKNEWRERVYTYLLNELTREGPEAARYTRLYRDWEKERPYGRGSDAAAHETYPTYRRIKFDRFLEETMRDLPHNLSQAWVKRVRKTREEELSAYQQQISILAYLEPGAYGETRRPVPLAQAHIGLIYQGYYYLIPVCTSGSDQPADVTTVREQIAALMSHAPASPPVQLTSLARIRRAAWPDLAPKLNQILIKELEMLRLAPILLNCGPHSPHLPLAELRQAERGLGDHALTLFDTGETMVFDQSHIFFDGTWGAALAEIITQEALAWAVYLDTLPPVAAKKNHPFVLTFPFQNPELDLMQQAPQILPEVSAETEAVNIKAILKLRKLFKLRNDLLQLTVNDLLVLYRAIHAAVYQPDPDLITALQALTQAGHRDAPATDTPATDASAIQAAAKAALEAIERSQQVNPAMVIPVDGSQRTPRDRLYPMTFEVPLNDLDLLDLHQKTVAALDVLQSQSGAAGYRDALTGHRDAPATGDAPATLYAEFDQLQRIYLATLAGFGAVLSKAKEIAISGESASVGTIKLLAHMPTPLQRMLDKIPSRFDVLNDIIKGREVFSNIGAVAPTSTLTRFMTAKDDNDKKTLAWGIMTDANGVMRVTLRDFRPHVSLLQNVGHNDLATRIVRDYLDAYAHGLNNFIYDLKRITETSRETRLIKMEKKND